MSSNVYGTTFVKNNQSGVTNIGLLLMSVFYHEEVKIKYRDSNSIDNFFLSEQLFVNAKSYKNNIFYSNSSFPNYSA